MKKHRLFLFIFIGVLPLYHLCLAQAVHQDPRPIDPEYTLLFQSKDSRLAFTALAYRFEQNEREVVEILSRYNEQGWSESVKSLVTAQKAKLKALVADLGDDEITVNVRDQQISVTLDKDTRKALKEKVGVLQQRLESLKKTKKNPTFTDRQNETEKKQFKKELRLDKAQKIFPKPVFPPIETPRIEPTYQLDGGEPIKYSDEPVDSQLKEQPGMGTPSTLHLRQGGGELENHQAKRYWVDRALDFLFPTASAQPSVTANSLTCYPDASDPAAVRALDLDGTPDEIAIDAEIQALAASLDYSPVKIFEYVTNEITFEPYRGSTKGALGTLVSGGGNDIDTASLLIALFRASNIPARYVRGLIFLEDMPEHYHWWRTLDLESSVKAASQFSHMATTTISPYSGSGRDAGSLHHVWVEACVPYTAYRGTGKTDEGYRWIPLDASYKKHTPKVGIQESIPFDYDEFLEKRTKKLPHELYAEQLLEHVRTVSPAKPDASLADIGNAWTQEKVSLEFLPDSLPYVIQNYVTWGGGVDSSRTSQVTSNWIAEARITFDANPVVTVPLRLFANHRVTLSFDDAGSLIESFRNGTAVNCASASHRIQVTPTIKVDGVALAGVSLSPVNLCKQSGSTWVPATYSMSIIDYVNNVRERPSTVSFGSISPLAFYNLQVYSGQASNEYLDRRYQQFIQAVNANSSGEPWDAPEEVVGEFLHLVLIKYLKYSADVVAFIDPLHGNTGYIGRSIGVTKTRFDVEYLFDLPLALNSSEFVVDVPGQLSKSLAASGGGGPNYAAFLLGGFAQSHYETYVWQENALKDAISTVTGLQIASEDERTAEYSTRRRIGGVVYDGPSKIPQSIGVFSSTSATGLIAQIESFIIFQEKTIRDYSAYYNCVFNNGIPACQHIYDNIYASEPFWNEAPDGTLFGPITGYSKNQRQVIRSEINQAFSRLGSGATVEVRIPRLLTLYNSEQVWAGSGHGLRYIPLWAGISYFVGGRSADGQTLLGSFPIGDYTSEYPYFAFAGGGWTIPTTSPSSFVNPLSTCQVCWSSSDLFSNANAWSTGFNTSFTSLSSFNQNTFNYSLFDIEATLNPSGLYAIPSIINSGIGLGNSHFNTLAFDPVNMVTGNMYHEETDFEVPARGLPLVFKRTYNSRSIDTGVLGKGWIHSYEQSLKFVDASGAGGTPTEAIWTTSDGGKRYISIKGAPRISGALNLAQGDVDAPDGFYFQLTRPYTATLQPFEIREREGTVFGFEAVAGNDGEMAKLIYIKDKNGNQITLNYTADKLSTVVDSDGRAIQFSYNTNDQLDSVELAWTDEAYTFFYNSNNQLERYQAPHDQVDNRDTSYYAYYDSTAGPGSDGRMKSFAYANGHKMTFEYYANGKVYQHTNELDETVTFNYNDYRREAISIDERGNEQRYFFNPNGLPLEIVYADGSKEVYKYEDTNDPMLRTRSIDAMGLETTYTYDSDGNLTTETTPSGDTVEYYHYNAFGHPQLIKNLNNDFRVEKYDTNGNRTDVIALTKAYSQTIASNPQGFNPVTFDPTFDPQIQSEPVLLSWERFTYDPYGKLASSRQVADFTDANAGPMVTYAYNDTANGVQSINPVSVSYLGDANGDGMTDPGEGLGTFTNRFDSRSRLLEGFNRSLYPITHKYYASGQLLSATDAIGEERHFTYDDAGLLLSQSLLGIKNGIVSAVDGSSTNYDLANRPTMLTDASGAVTRHEYDKAGNLIKTVTPDGYTVSFEYDSRNRLVNAFDEEGNAVSRQLDGNGRLLSITDPNGNTTQYRYYGAIENGRLHEVRQLMKASDGRSDVTTVFYYDNAGQVIKTEDALGRSTLTDYDALGRTKRVLGPAYNDSVLGHVRPVTRYTYDALGRVTLIEAGHNTDAANGGSTSDTSMQTQSAYTYDDFGRLRTETNALGKVWLYQDYDSHGNLLQSQDPNGNVTAYSYGYGGQLTSRTTTGPDVNASVSYTRNELGQPLTVTTHNVTYTFTYDTAHRVNTVHDSRGNKTLTYQYSIGGRLNKMIDSDGGTTAYIYDPVGRLSGVRSPNLETVGLSYDAGGRLAAQYYPNGLEAVYDYFSDNAVRTITHRDRATKSTLAQYSYNYNDAGETTTLGVDYVALNGQPNQDVNYSYQYDGAGRLNTITTNATGYGLSLIENIHYDPFGNRRSYSVNDGTNTTQHDYVHNALHQINRIDIAGSTPTLLSQFSYDNNGNLTAKTTGADSLTLNYDGWGRATHINATVNGTSVSQHNEYDHSSRRIARTVDGVAEYYLYSGADMIAEYSHWATQPARYTHGPLTDHPLMRSQEDGWVDYYHADAMGSVTLTTNPTIGSVFQIGGINHFDAFGNQRIATVGNPEQQYGFTGREGDPTGLMYYRARYYDPGVGRFAQPDPAGFVDGVNRYVYALNSPVNYVDPWGLSASSPTLDYYSSGYYGIDVNNFLASKGAYGYGDNSSRLDSFQLGLDAAGLTPGFGIVADVLNAGVSAFRGDWVGAGLSVFAAVPVVGQFATGGKLADNALDAGRGGFVSTPKGSAKFDVGAYNDIKGTVLGMDAHHVGQKAVMKKFVDDYDPNTAPAILVPQVGHTIRKDGVGVVSRSTSGFQNARQVIARDIKELRRVYPEIPNSNLRQLIDMNRNMYPNALKK